MRQKKSPIHFVHKVYLCVSYGSINSVYFHKHHSQIRFVMKTQYLFCDQEAEIFNIIYMKSEASK
jgi:hypothetical protein